MHTIEWHCAQTLCGVLENAGLQFTFRQEYYSMRKKLTTKHNDRQKLPFHKKFLSPVQETELKISS